jgi:hypothetical protein
MKADHDAFVHSSSQAFMLRVLRQDEHSNWAGRDLDLTGYRRVWTNSFLQRTQEALWWVYLKRLDAALRRAHAGAPCVMTACGHNH